MLSLNTHSTLKFRFVRGASSSAISITLIGPAHLGGLEHGEDFAAIVIGSGRAMADLSSLDVTNLSLGSHSAPSLERFREGVVRIERQIGVERP